MVFADWTFSTGGTGISWSGALDTGTKYAGNSSYKAHVESRYSGYIYSYLTHDTFSEPAAQLIFWVRKWRNTTINSATSYSYGHHSSYARVLCVMDYDVWEKHRVTFWYDLSSNIKFGRDEKWDGGAWVATGSDVNCGSGSPAAGSISLASGGYSTGAAADHYSWFDEVEVSV